MIMIMMTTIIVKFMREIYLVATPPHFSRTLPMLNVMIIIVILYDYDDYDYDDCNDFDDYDDYNDCKIQEIETENPSQDFK